MFIRSIYKLWDMVILIICSLIIMGNTHKREGQLTRSTELTIDWTHMIRTKIRRLINNLTRNKSKSPLQQVSYLNNPLKIFRISKEASKIIWKTRRYRRSSKITLVKKRKKMCKIKRLMWSLIIVKVRARNALSHQRISTKKT